MKCLLHSAALAALSIMATVDAKAVFAHFMVGNTENYTSSDWLDDMRLAKNAHIDAFALNMAHGDPVNEQALPAAFSAAASVGLSLFFSFDYAGHGFWPPDTVIQYINKYASSGSYFHYNGRPFVSTFEGPDNATDWIGIKQQTSCFFMPDWSSLGAKKAMAAAGGVADGLFSWAAWPWGYWDMYTYSDASYHEYLGGKPYMMPVSPWFYTNLPGYDKNWLWRGDAMWGDRWFQAQALQPEFVEIISWNDYGESHYIGPVRDKAMEAFDVGRAPFNYGTLPHDSWRDILPFVIDMYKNNVSTIDFERAIAWYKLAPATADKGSGCDRNGTVGNTASQLQIEWLPEEIMEDKIFYVALLSGPPDKVECFVGGSTFYGLTLQSPEGNGAGMYTGECGTSSMAGAVHVRVTRGSQVLDMTGEPITTDCQRWNGFMNYNAYVMGTVDPGSIPHKAADISNQVCVNGTGMSKVEALCRFSCSHGYCPPGACVCTRLGKPPTLPKAKNIDGYPTAQYDESFSGLCSFACNYGDCASFAPACSTTKVPLPIWPESLFDPPYCTGGSSTNDYFDELCQFTCAHGFCPLAVCDCDTTGFFNDLEPTIASNASTPSQMPDSGLCKFACKRGFCPADKCFENGDWDPDGDFGPDYDPIEDEYLDTSVVDAWICNPEVAPTNLDDLIIGMDEGYIPPACWDQWALTILFNTLLSFKSQFAEAVKGYDPLYNAYEGWVKDSVNPQLRTFVNPETGHGAKYFDCIITVVGDRPTTKKDCQSAGEDLHDGSYANSDWTVEFSLRDENGFYDSVAAEMGIQRDWITFGGVDLGYSCADKDNVGPPTHTQPCSKLYHRWRNAPISVNKDDIKGVANPKTVIEAAMPNMTVLADTLMVAFLDMVMGISDAEDGDIVTASSMPIFMLQQAIDSMQQIKDIGSKIIEENKQKLISLILSIVLMAIPFVGEAGGALFGGVAMIARIAALVDIVGNTALTAYDIIGDPESAPFAILGLVVGFGVGARSEKEAFQEAGKARRGLSSSDIAKMGDTFVRNDAKIQKVVNTCARTS